MRYKVVPEVRDIAFLRSVRDALPLVPGSVEDCCTRIRDRTDLASRDDARAWLTFLEALGLAAETSRGYHRVREESDQGELATAFEEHIFGARELLEILDDENDTSVSDAFDVIRDEIPRWERSRYPDWEREWHKRVERLLEWGVVFELLEHAGEGYRLADEGNLYESTP